MRAWVMCCWLTACGAAGVPATPANQAPASPRTRSAREPAERATAVVVPAQEPPEARPNSKEEPLLVRRFPALRGVPWVSLMPGPSPVERASGLERRLKIAGVFVKRDDLSAPLYAGGKPRKLEFLLGEALEQGHSRVVTWGGVGSNQAVATAAHAGQLGLATTLLLLPQQATPEVKANLLADAHFGATLELVASQKRASELAQAAGAYAIPIGGSSPLGNLGFVNAALELDEQIRAGELPEPDAVYIPMGTMGSAVGLAIGLRAAGRKTRVVAVRASNLNTSSREHFETLFDETLAYISARDPSFPRIDFSDAAVVLEGAQLGKGYAIPTDAGRRAVALARELAGLELETTYTGKALAQLIADAPRLSDSTVLFWNTHNSRPLPGDDGDRERVPDELRGYLR